MRQALVANAAQLRQKLSGPFGDNEVHPLWG